MPGKSTTGKGKIGRSRTPRTLSKASLMIGKIDALSNFSTLDSVRGIIADDVTEVSSETGFCGSSRLDKVW